MPTPLYKNGEIADSKIEQMKRALVTLSIDNFPKSKGPFILCIQIYMNTRFESERTSNLWKDGVISAVLKVKTLLPYLTGNYFIYKWGLS